MAKPRPWFKFWVDDWQTSETVRLASWGARGVYVEMLCYQWREGSLPGDPKKVAKLVGCPVKLVLEILEAFPYDDPDGRRRNLKMEEVRADAEAVSEKRRAASQKRWSGDAIASGVDMQKASDERGERKEERRKNETLVCSKCVRGLRIDLSPVVCCECPDGRVRAKNIATQRGADEREAIERGEREDAQPDPRFKALSDTLAEQLGDDIASAG